MLRVVEVADANAFLARTRALRGEHPVLTNIIGSVATGVSLGRAYESCLWLLVEDGTGVIGCAVRTAPWNLAVSPMVADAAAELGRFVAHRDPAAPGIVGPPETVATVGAAAGWTLRPRLSELLRVLGTYRRPAAVPGAGRPAMPGDLDLLLEWLRQFHLDAGLQVREIEAIARARSADGSTWLWAVDGQPVSLAGHGPIVDTPAGACARIGPVYTPSHLRGRGYGAAITALVTELLIPRAQLVMLVTDASNATSNGVYERLGFEVAGELVEAERVDGDARPAGQEPGLGSAPP